MGRSVSVTRPGAIVSVVTATGRVLLCKADELPTLANPGRGVTLIKVDDNDAVMAFGVGGRADKEVMVAETDAGKKLPVGPGRYAVSGRGGRGHSMGRKLKITHIIFPEPDVSPPPAPGLN